MLITTKCGCGKTNVSDIDVGWASNGSTPIQCKSCGNVYMVVVNADSESINIEDEDENSEDQEPKKKAETYLELGVDVIVDNKDHKLHGLCGTIIDKDDLHYRIQINDDTIHNPVLWVPHHWVSLKKKNTTK